METEPDRELWDSMGSHGVLVGEIRSDSNIPSRRTVQGLPECTAGLGLSNRSGSGEYSRPFEATFFAADWCRMSPDGAPSLLGKSLLGKMLGGRRKSSVRAGYGIF